MLVTRSEWCQSELSAAITHACRNSALQQPMSTRHPCSWKNINKYIYIYIYIQTNHYEGEADPEKANDKIV